MAPRKSTQSASSGKKRARGSTRDVEDDEEQEEEEQNSDDEGNNNKNKGKGKKAAASKGKGKKKALEQSDGEGDGEEDEDETAGKKSALSLEDRNQLVQDFTRYILFCEYTRKPIRRDEMTKALLTAEKRGRHFPDLILRAQLNLKDIFGMELVGLRAKEGVKSSSKTYVLRSTLPLELIKATVSTSFPELRDEEEEEQNTGGLKGVWKDVAKYQAQNTDIMRDYSKDQGGAYGILGVILGLILVSGKVLGDEQLRSYLRRLGLDHEELIPKSVATAHPMTISNYLNLLIKQNYLEKSKTAGAIKQTLTQQQKGAGEPGVEWKWGGRAEVEIGETGIANFLKTIYLGELELEGESDEEGEPVQGAAPKVKKLDKTKKFYQEVKRAANTTDLASPYAVEALQAA